VWCNLGRAPAGLGANLYGFDIAEHEFWQEDCQCDQIPPRNAGWEISWVVRNTTEFCRKEFPVTLTHWHGTFIGFSEASTYRNNEDCSWFIDIDPTTAGGHKAEKLDIYLEQMNTDSGRGEAIHLPADILTIYKGHERTVQPCFDACVEPVGVFKWVECKTHFDTNTSVQMSRPSCVISKQWGDFVVCDPTNVYTYHKTCWDSPNHWGLNYAKARIDFQSSSEFVGGNFRIRWEAEISSALHSTVFGKGSVMSVAGEVANVTMQAKWLDKDGIVQNRTTGGAEVTLRLRYNNQSHFETNYQHARDTGDGFYHMYYVPKFAGVHTLHVDLFGDPVAGSPYTVIVSPGTVDPSRCKAYDTEKVDITEIGGLTGGRAGREYTFKVECEDEYGNHVNRKSEWDSAPFMIKFEGLQLYWGTVDDEGTGVYTVYFNIPLQGEYKIHILYRLTFATYSAIHGSPFDAVIEKVPCPIVGEPPCDSNGVCLDTGKCQCNPGYDGEYCQTDLAQWFRVAIALENAILGTLLLMFAFNRFWKHCVKEKQMFERLTHDDAEQDW